MLRVTSEAQKPSITELPCLSPRSPNQRHLQKSFEDAIQRGLARASKTLRNVRSAWIKEQRVWVEKGKIVEYQVNMMVTFVLDD